MSQKIEKGFLLQQAIDQSIDTIVQMTEETLPKTLVSQIGDMNSQLSNFLSVTKSAPTARVVTNWVRYQTGRKGGDVAQKWRAGDLAQKVCRDIDSKIGQMAEKITRDLEIEQNEVEMMLVRQYAGYLRRTFIANTPQERKERNKR